MVKFLCGDIFMDIFRLKEVREDLDYKQKDVAKYLNITQAQYSRYELGINMIPIDKLDKLATLYNTSIDYLLNRTNERNITPKKEKIYQINR